jgi:hypothetical protein
MGDFGVANGPALAIEALPTARFAGSARAAILAHEAAFGRTDRRM